MEIIETTKPVERTFDIQNLSSLELRVLRLALTKFKEEEKSDRLSQDDHRQAIANDISRQGGHAPAIPMPMSLEEASAKEMLEAIRHMERLGIIKKEEF